MSVCVCGGGGGGADPTVASMLVNSVKLTCLYAWLYL